MGTRAFFSLGHRRCKGPFFWLLLSGCILAVAPAQGAPVAQGAQTAIAHYTQGLRHLNRMNYYEAAEQFHEALRLNPDYGDAWFSLADCEYNFGNFDLCLSYLDKAETYSRDAPGIGVLRAFAFIGQNKLTEADALLRTVLKKAPNNVAARFGLAELDLFHGRISAAEQQYLDALRREGTNRRVLLSLALLAAETGKFKEAEHYVDEAIRYHAANPEVHYLAAYLALERGRFAEADLRARNALELDGEYDRAYDIQAIGLFLQGRYDEAAALCAERSASHPASFTPWSVLALAQEKLLSPESAVDTLAAALARFPKDEILRLHLELLLDQGAVPPDDPRRPSWAAFHGARARSLSLAFRQKEAIAEYQAALRVDGKNQEAALNLAEILRSEGYRERYLRSLKTAAALGPLSPALNDRLEGYESLLADGLENRWGVDAAGAAREGWKVSVYYTQNRLQLRHVDAERIIASALARNLSEGADFSAGVPVTAKAAAVQNYAGAFRDARKNGADYFTILTFDENDRELTLSAALYSGKTGSGIDKVTAYAAGDDRVKTAIALVENAIRTALPAYGTIVARKASEVLVDLGGLKVGDTLAVVKKGGLVSRDAGKGLVYRATDQNATVTITPASDDFASGTVRFPGLRDLVNSGDTVFRTDTANIYEAAAEPRSPAAVTDIRVGTTPASRLPGIIGILRSLR